MRRLLFVTLIALMGAIACRGSQSAYIDRVIPLLTITLPDGSQRQFDNAVTVQDVAASIGAGLAKAALAGKVDGKLVDTSFRIEHDAKLEIVTEKSPDALEIIRHSTAHLLAQATQRLFPDTQVTIGPVVENGFYYDFARKTPFTPEDLEKIEAEMKKIAAENLEVKRSVMPKDDAIRFFKDKGEIYKAQIIDDIIPAGEEISLYGQGEWIDLCRGPHVPRVWPRRSDGRRRRSSRSRADSAHRTPRGARALGSRPSRRSPTM